MTPFTFSVTLTPGALSATVYTPAAGEWLGVLFGAYVRDSSEGRQVVMTDGVTVIRGTGYAGQPPDPPAPWGTWSFFRSGAPIVVSVDGLSPTGNVLVGGSGMIFPASETGNLRLVNG